MHHFNPIGKLLVLLSTFVFPTVESVANQDPPRMNLVFILVDDPGWKDLGCYGSAYYNDLAEELPDLAASLHRRLRNWRLEVGADPMRPNAEYCRTKTALVGMREVNPPTDGAVANTIALVGGRLIDGRGGPPVEDAIVVVKGNTIIAAGPRNQIGIPQDAETTDIAGMSLLPGLIDSHFHSRNNVKTPVEYELKHGVTSFRDPGHPFRFYDAVTHSEKVMPRVFLCGAHLDAHPPVWADQAVVIQDADHARRTVHQHVDRGASAIKVYFRLPLEHIEATCEAANERNVIVTAHLELVDALSAIRAGVRGIEHVTSFGTALARAEDAERFKSAIDADSDARKELRYRLWASLNLDASSKVAPVLDTVLRHQVFISPTLAVFERRPGQKNATDVQARGFQNMMRFVSRCHQAGAKIVPGSHTHAPFAAPGRAYQRELELLVEAGMTPLQAITAGTVHNAQFLGVDQRLGSIEAGKTADLILIEGDPSTTIAAMRNVTHVMLNGSWVFEKP